MLAGFGAIFCQNFGAKSLPKGMAAIRGKPFILQGFCFTGDVFSDFLLAGVSADRGRRMEIHFGLKFFFYRLSRPSLRQLHALRACEPRARSRKNCTIRALWGERGGGRGRGKEEAKKKEKEKEKKRKPQRERDRKSERQLPLLPPSCVVLPGLVFALGRAAASRPRHPSVKTRAPGTGPDGKPISCEALWCVPGVFRRRPVPAPPLPPLRSSPGELECGTGPGQRQDTNEQGCTQSPGM